MYYIYMIRCMNNSIYTGITNDLERRMGEHKGKSKKCAKYTLLNTFDKLEKVWSCDERRDACKLEYHIKKLSKNDKEHLILTGIQDVSYLYNKVDIDLYKKYIYSVD